MAVGVDGRRRRLDGRAMRGQKAAGREGQIEPLLVRAQERGNVMPRA